MELHFMIIRFLGFAKQKIVVLYMAKGLYLQLK